MRHRKAAGLPGGSRAAVEKAILTGRVDLKDILAGRYEACDQQWADRTDPIKAKGTATARARETKAAGQGAAAARLEREGLRLRREALALALDEGRYMDAEAVRRAWFAEGQRVRDLLLAVPARVAPEILAAVRSETDNSRAVAAVVPLLDAALRRAMASLDQEPKA